MASVIHLFSVRPETRPAAAEPHRRRRHVQHGARRRGRRRANGRPRVLRLRLAPSHRQSRAEQREQDVDGVGQRDAPAEVRRVGAVSRHAASSAARARPARRRSAGPTWMRSSAIATAASSADGISRSDRASRSRPAIRTSSRSTARRTSSPIRRTRRSSAISSRRFPHRIFSTTRKQSSERHHFEYRADAVVARNQTLTAAFAYDGERGVLTNHRSTAAPQRPERNNTGTTVQYEATG